MSKSLVRFWKSVIWSLELSCNPTGYLSLLKLIQNFFFCFLEKTDQALGNLHLGITLPLHHAVIKPWSQRALFSPFKILWLNRTVRIWSQPRFWGTCFYSAGHTAISPHTLFLYHSRFPLVWKTQKITAS